MAGSPAAADRRQRRTAPAPVPARGRAAKPEAAGQADKDQASASTDHPEPYRTKAYRQGCTRSDYPYRETVEQPAKTLLDRLPKTGSRVVVRKKDVSMKDLSALTASTGNEFAMFTKGGERLIVRGNAYRTPIGIKDAKELREEGYRWSGHTHPGIDHNCLQASSGDIEVLNVFGQEFSVIYNSIGAYQVFS